MLCKQHDILLWVLKYLWHTVSEELYVGNTAPKILYLSTAPTASGICVCVCGFQTLVEKWLGTQLRESSASFFSGFSICYLFQLQRLTVYKNYLYTRIIRNIFVEKSKFVSKRMFWKVQRCVQIQVRFGEQMCTFF